MQIRDPYKVLVRVRDHYGCDTTIELGELTLADAIRLARRLSAGEGDDASYWEIIDRFTGNVVASSDSESEKRKGRNG